MDLFNTEEKKEKAVLVGVHTGRMDYLNDCTEESMLELALLADTAGAEVIGSFVQNRPNIDRATYIGEGKAEEIRIFCEDNGADVVIFDDELTPSQVRNLEKMIDHHVIDRSALIMDIFASSAKTREGKLQVELAQLRYFLPRLTGSFVNLSRLGGGIGTRGPGETKLETDRRHIRNRLTIIKDQIDEVQKNRDTQRRQRVKEGVQQIAIVGYTNAGKSTLLNFLTDAGVLAENKLFATLDPTARKLLLPDGTNALLIDTVGFIRKLPHHLIKAFKSTLEEAMLADVLIHVADASSPDVNDNITVVEALIEQLKASGKPTITVYNKMDIKETDVILPPRPHSLGISAKTGARVKELLDMLTEVMPERRKRVEVLIPYSKGNIVAQIHDFARINSETHTENGTLMEIIVDTKGLSIVSEYIV